MVVGAVSGYGVCFVECLALWVVVVLLWLTALS